MCALVVVCAVFLGSVMLLGGVIGSFGVPVELALVLGVVLTIAIVCNSLKK